MCQPKWKKKDVVVPQHPALKPGKGGHCIDHFLVPQSLYLLDGVKDVRTFNGTVVDKLEEFKAMDHALVIMTVAASSKSSIRQCHIRKKVVRDHIVIDREKMKDAAHQVVYEDLRKEHQYRGVGGVEGVPLKADDIYLPYRDQLIQDFRSCFGMMRPKDRIWLSEETKLAIEKKKRLLADLCKSRVKDKLDSRIGFCQQRRVCKRLIRRDKKKFLFNIAAQLNDVNHHPSMKEIYKALDLVAGKQGGRLEDQSIKGEDGEFVEGGLKERNNAFADHFRRQLNVHKTTSAAMVEEAALPAEVTTPVCGIGDNGNSSSIPVLLLLTVEEIKEAITKLHNGKAADAAGVIPEMLKIGQWDVECDLVRIINDMVATDEIPTAWTEAMIVPLYKGKGDAAMPTNYRAIVITDIISKVFTRAIYNQLYEEVDGKILESQAGFRCKRSLNDHVFVMRQLMEAAREYDKPLHAAFIDIEKAYDGIPRLALLAVLKRYGVSERLCQLISMLYNKTSARVRIGDEESDLFDIETGVKQGCILSTLLFNIYMDFVMRQVIPSIVDRGVVWHVRDDLDPMVRKEKGRLDEEAPKGWHQLIINHLLYADDTTLVASSYEELISMVEMLDGEFDRWGLRVSIKKTVIASFNDRRKDRSDFYLRGSLIPNIPNKKEKSFRFLGSLLDFQEGSSEPDMMRRIHLAQGVVRRLGESVWRLPGISLGAKLETVKKMVLPVLLHGCETWNLNDKALSKLEGFMSRVLARVMRIKRTDHVAHAEIRHRYGMCVQGSMKWHVRYRQLRWFGHVVRMDESRWPVQVMCGRPPDSRRPRKKPAHRWIDTIYQHLADLGVPTREYHVIREEAMERSTWREMIKSPMSCQYCERDELVTEIIDEIIGRVVDPTILSESQSRARVVEVNPEATWEDGSTPWFYNVTNAGPSYGRARSGRNQQRPNNNDFIIDYGGLGSKKGLVRGKGSNSRKLKIKKGYCIGGCGKKELFNPFAPVYTNQKVKEGQCWKCLRMIDDPE